MPNDFVANEPARHIENQPMAKAGDSEMMKLHDAASVSSISEAKSMQAANNSAKGSAESHLPSLTLEHKESKSGGSSATSDKHSGGNPATSDNHCGGAAPRGDNGAVVDHGNAGASQKGDNGAVVDHGNAGASQKGDNGAVVDHGNAGASQKGDNGGVVDHGKNDTMAHG